MKHRFNVLSKGSPDADFRDERLRKFLEIQRAFSDFMPFCVFCVGFRI